MLSGFEHLAASLLRALKIDPHKVIGDVKQAASNVETLARNIDQRLTRIEGKLDFIMEKKGWNYAERLDGTEQGGSGASERGPIRLITGGD